MNFYQPYIRRVLLAGFTLLWLGFAYPQKKITKTVCAKSIDFVEINATQCFKVEIATHGHPEIKIMVVAGGEYQNDILISAKEEEGSLFLSPGLRPLFTNPNDKLSMHKILSVALTITVPENLAVNILGASTRITAAGKYKVIEVRNVEGDVALKNIAGRVLVNTVSGNIDLTMPSGSVDAYSKFGKVYLAGRYRGTNNYVLNTVKGSIYVNNNE
ncbi:hypothetical protein [Abyssalbus ytuae]|uniref:Adhesin domain-containing protein n=1 Tax=Abyssalbus ytuae TaxID=2926907 RepID=A0A9E6ZNI1_9FLAO|nr:hypothetical protein [Abyssalbus ytuae]UOB19142.1 hypothetical protein MQE35_07550 [Abyssalbus ytuae]